jgi:ParB family chromosome partitioning protein
MFLPKDVAASLFSSAGDKIFIQHPCLLNYFAKVLPSCFSLHIDNFPALRHFARMAKPALGRGLGALLGGNPLVQPAPAPTVQPSAIPMPAPDNRERVLRVPLNRIRPSALQPRKEFSGESLRELADSIREQGIVQPLIVRERDGFFELIAGERRWRAAQLLNLPEVPVITREADDRAVLELALIENLQRENLNAIEEAHGYAQLAEQFRLTQEEIALKVGKSRAVVANATRLLKLPESVQKFVREGRLSVSHAKVILGLADEKIQKFAAERVIKEGLNVRQTEGLVAKLQSRNARKAGDSLKTVAVPIGNPHVADLEAKLREVFATKVQLNYAQGKGSLEISFFSDAELERILQILGVKAG